jgi:hypothetical protein
VDGDQIGQAIELGREGLDRRNDEERVRQAAALRWLARPSRSLDHAGGAGVQTDDQLVGMGGRSGQHVSAVAGAGVNSDRGVRRRGIGESADVDFGEPPAVQDVHAAMIIDR